MGLDGSMGSNNKETYNLPFKPIAEDLARLKDIIKERSVLITGNSYDLLPKSFKEYLKTNCIYTILLSSKYVNETHLGGNMYGVSYDTSKALKHIRPSLRDCVKSFLEESDVVYIGGSYFVDDALHCSDYSFITFTHTDPSINVTHRSKHMGARYL